MNKAAKTWQRRVRRVWVRQLLLMLSQFNQGYLLSLVAVIGTTIAPWMQFYQQSAIADKQISPAHLQFERIDIYVGAFLTDFIAFFIVICTGATLYVNHIQITQASDAALALVPLVRGNGQLAEYLFAVGLLNASLMAASVLQLSTAYSISEAFGWERGIGRKFKEAPQFFFLYTFVIVVGAGITLFVPSDRLVFVLNLPNVIGGMLLPLILVLMIILCNDRRLLGRHVNGHVRNWIGLDYYPCQDHFTASSNWSITTRDMRGHFHFSQVASNVEEKASDRLFVTTHLPVFQTDSFCMRHSSS